MGSEKYWNPRFFSHHIDCACKVVTNFHSVETPTLEMFPKFRNQVRKVCKSQTETKPSNKADKNVPRKSHRFRLGSAFIFGHNVKGHRTGGSPFDVPSC